MIPRCFRFRSEEELKSYENTYEYYALIDMDKKSNLPLNAWKDLTISVSEVDMDAYVKCDAFRKNILKNVEDGKGLFIHGGVGNGKSTWAYKIARQYMELKAGKRWNEKTIPVYFVNVPAFLNELKYAFNDTEKSLYLDKVLTTADIVIFDDLGAENATEWAKEKLYQLIDNRYSNSKTCIFTSNKRLTEMDVRIADRIRGMCEVIEFRMQSQRTK